MAPDSELNKVKAEFEEALKDPSCLRKLRRLTKKLDPQTLSKCLNGTNGTHPKEKKQ